jgi:hypothetical protein
MRHHHPNFNTTVTGRLLRSVGSLQPTPTSRSYAVIIFYQAGEQPGAFVPGLLPRTDAERIPHTYGPDRPCLFYPPGREWRSDMTIATTIVPWLSLWLYYYEIWLATGSWQGGGVDHEPKSEKVDVSHT